MESDTERNRVFGRIIADNIGPFIQKLMVIEQQRIPMA